MLAYTWFEMRLLKGLKKDRVGEDDLGSTVLQLSDEREKV